MLSSASATAGAMTVAQSHSLTPVVYEAGTTDGSPQLFAAAIFATFIFLLAASRVMMWLSDRFIKL